MKKDLRLPDGSVRTLLKAKRGPVACPVRVRGVVYPSIKECAKHFGYSETHIRTLLNQGRVDMLGLLKRGTVQRGKVNGKSIPLKIGPLVFESISEARVALGVNRKKIYDFIRHNKHAEEITLKVRALYQKPGSRTPPLT